MATVSVNIPSLPEKLLVAILLSWQQANETHGVNATVYYRSIMLNNNGRFLLEQDPDRVRHDSSVGEWMYLTVNPLHGLGSIPGSGREIQVSFPWPITLCQPSWASAAESGSISAQWHYTNCGHWRRGRKSNHGQPITEKMTQTTWVSQSSSWSAIGVNLNNPRTKRYRTHSMRRCLFIYSEKPRWVSTCV